MKRTLGYLVESAYNHPEAVYFVFFVAAFGLLIGSQITELEVNEGSSEGR